MAWRVPRDASALDISPEGATGSSALGEVVLVSSDSILECFSLGALVRGKATRVGGDFTSICPRIPATFSEFWPETFPVKSKGIGRILTCHGLSTAALPRPNSPFANLVALVCSTHRPQIAPCEDRTGA